MVFNFTIVLVTSGPGKLPFTFIIEIFMHRAKTCIALGFKIQLWTNYISGIFKKIGACFYLLKYIYQMFWYVLSLSIFTRCAVL